MKHEKPKSLLAILPLFLFFFSMMVQADKLSLPDGMYEALEYSGFSDDELDNASIDNKDFVIIFDDENLEIERALRTINVICEFTRSYPSDFKSSPYSNIILMPFTQTKMITFRGGIKTCLYLPQNATKRELRKYIEIGRGR
ncbi:hypothetical protein [Atlantibacter hermannii]|uniref:hypothetical protein n=2 Tax=Atlantibacter hermannii TaxID=565 RepID=UPI00289C0F0B|nr:hypothetical protein [Atlantibacter hermannii]